MSTLKSDGLQGNRIGKRFALRLSARFPSSRSRVRDPSSASPRGAHSRCLFTILSFKVLRVIRAIWGLLVPASVALVVLGNGSAVGSTVLPDPDELPTTMVAVVPAVPGPRGRITKGEFQHALLLEAVSAGHRSAPRAGGAGYKKSKVVALKSLLEGAWIVGLATEWGISVTHAQVSREVAKVREESFKDGAEFRRFLREARYTRRDVNERVEIQMLSARLQWHLSRRTRKETSSKSEEQRAFEEFVVEFQERWRGRTVCAPDYAISLCSNGPAA